MGEIHIPGVGNVELGQPQQPDPLQILMAEIKSLRRDIDMLFQATMRLATGWEGSEVIEDMKLTVKAPPTVDKPRPVAPGPNIRGQRPPAPVTQLNREQRRMKPRG